MSATQAQGYNLILVNSWTVTPLKCLSFNHNFHASLTVFFPVYVFFHFPLQHLQFLRTLLFYITTIFSFIAFPVHFRPNHPATQPLIQSIAQLPPFYATLPRCTTAEIKRHWISNYLTSNTFTRATDCSKAPLHINLQAANFQRCKCAFTCPIT